MRSSRALPFFIISCLWLGTLALVGPYDLAISRQLYIHEGSFGHLIRVWGTLPSGLAQLGAVLWLLIPAWRRRSDLISLLAVTLLVMSILQPYVITTLLKGIWGRTRFFDLHGDWSRFTPFWSPAPSGTGLSFPSGHTATAVVFSPLAAQLWREGQKKASTIMATATLAWGLTVALGRIIHGAHYATDVIFSLGLSILLAPFVADWSRLIWLRWFREPVAHGR